MPNRSVDPKSIEAINSEASNQLQLTDDSNATNDFRSIIQLSLLFVLIYFLLTNGAISLENFFYLYQMN